MELDLCFLQLQPSWKNPVFLAFAGSGVMKNHESHLRA